MDEAICEVCGKKTPRLYSVMIEGSKMYVCKECASLGKKIKESSKQRIKIHKIINEEMEETLVEGYAEIIRKAIYARYGGLADFCKKYNLKESWLKKVLDEELPLTLDEAKKLEKLLKVKLITKENQILEIQE